MANTRNLFESATARARVQRQGDLVCLTIDGGGAMVMSSQDFMQAQKWAQSRAGSGNLLSDRARLLAQIPAMVCRPGSMLPTQGHERTLAKLAGLMRQGGYDLSEWQLPPELKAPPKPDPLPARAKSAEASADAPSDQASEPPVQDPLP